MSGNAGRSKNTPLWIIVGLSASPFILATLIYFFWKPTQGKSAGTLLTPIQQMPNVPLTTADGQPFAAEKLRGKWLLMTVHQGPCAKLCQDTLFRMRQVRTGTGEAMNRVQRVWIGSRAADLNGAPAQFTDGVFRLTDAGRMTSYLPASGGGLAGAVYLVDPQGNLVMRYDPIVDPVKMMREVTKILKLNNGLG